MIYLIASADVAHQIVGLPALLLQLGRCETNLSGYPRTQDLFSLADELLLAGVINQTLVFGRSLIVRGR